MTTTTIVSALWLLLCASAWYRVGRQRGRRLGRKEGFEKGARAAAAHMFPLLIAKGVTPTEFGIALEGCGRPDCEACASRAQHKQPN